MQLVLIALALATTTAPVTSDVPPIPPKIAAIMEKSDGLTRETAYKVRSVSDEYVIVRALGLKPGLQSLIVDGRKAYDLIEAEAPDGSKRELWFDISKFYGRF